MEEDFIVGIDLGTTNSAVAIWDPRKKEAVALPNQEKRPLTPSMVAFDADSGEAIVGEPAENLLLDHPEDVVYSVKRFIGLSYGDEQVRLSKDQVTYRIDRTAEDKVIIRAANRVLTPPQISKYVLEKLKRDAEELLGKPVTKAVITVPAYFTESQRHATIDAGKRANLEVRRLVNEPTAAALAFDLGSAPQVVTVYDLGGGTFDISIIEIKKGMHRVVATGGDNHLGGDDFDERIADWIKAEFRKEHEIALISDPFLEALLREKAEQAKIDLSEKQITRIVLPGLRTVSGASVDFELDLDRGTFETLVSELVEKTLSISDSVLAMARKKTGVDATDINQVLLVGGQTKTPAVQNALKEKYGWELNRSIEPDMVVGIGAAVLGGYLGNDPYLRGRMRLWDVIAQPLGIEVKAGTLADGRTMREIIKANQQIPVTTKRDPIEYTNDYDGQSLIRFEVYQGDDPIAKRNTHLGTVPLPLTSPKPKGEARVKFWFEIDWDGILEVHAKEVGAASDEIVEKIDYYYYLSQEKAEAIE